MEELKNLLPGVSELDIQKYVQSKGLSLENLSDEELAAIASDFTKLTTSQSGKAAKQGSKKGRSKQPANLPQAIAKVAKQTEDEMSSILGVVEEGVEQFAQVQSDKLLGIISEAPNRMMDYFAEKAEAYEGDPEGFRERGAEIVKGIFASF